MILILMYILISSEISGKVIYVTDGDTFHVLVNKEDKTVRLHAVDAPEKTQPFYYKSKSALEDKIKGKVVKLITHGKSYNRYVADVELDGESINEWIVAQGLAWNSPKYSTSEKLVELEKFAKQQKKGLWVDKNPESPWDFRARTSKKRNIKKKGKGFGN